MIILFFIKHLPTIFQGFVDIIKIPLKLILVKGVRQLAQLKTQTPKQKTHTHTHTYSFLTM